MWLSYAYVRIRLIIAPDISLFFGFLVRAVVFVAIYSSGRARSAI
jgi:hypothetical protein